MIIALSVLVFLLFLTIGSQQNKIEDLRWRVWKLEHEVDLPPKMVRRDPLHALKPGCFKGMN